jgi:hypothetical protein
MLAILLSAVFASTTMGSLNFPVTGNAQCKKHFTEGMLALHSFMYDRAHDRFAAAYKADPRCAMAHWGDAMTFNHPLWGEEDLASAKKTLAEIGDDARMTPTEKQLISAARVLFGDGDPKSRLRSWLEVAGRMHRDHPKDDELALQYALALIANSERLTDQKKLMQAAAIGMDVLQRNPQHPGAAHYIIHACDTPDHAVLALPAAERYAKIAPAASHALHMPTHIFVQLGMWERVARSNEAAWAASQADAKGKPIDKYDLHAYSWLAAAYLELGQAKRAEKLRAELAEWIAKEDHAYARVAYSDIAHLFVTDADAWDRLDPILKPISSPLPREEGDEAGSLGCAQHAPGGTLATRPPFGLMSLVRMRYLRAEAAMRRGEEAGVRAELDALKPLYESLEGWKAMYSATTYERRKAYENVFLLGARAYKDRGESSTGKAVEAIKKLTALGDPYANGPAFEPPGEQLLGDLYLATNKPKEALASYDAALVRHPRLSRSLLGAARAARAASLPDVARQRYAELADLWKDADPDLPALDEVRTGAKELTSGGAAPSAAKAPSP